MSGKGGMWSMELPKEVINKWSICYLLILVWAFKLYGSSGEGGKYVKWTLLSLQGPGQMIWKAPIWTQPRLKGSLPSQVVALGQRGYRALCLKLCWQSWSSGCFHWDSRMWVRGEKEKSQANTKGARVRGSSPSYLMLLHSLHYRRAGILAILCTGGSPSQTGHSNTCWLSPQQQCSTVTVQLLGAL